MRIQIQHFFKLRIWIPVQFRILSKILQLFFGSKIAIYFSLDLHIGRSSYAKGGAFSPQKRTSSIPLILALLTCTCRGIPIAPSRRMLETLLMDEGSLLLTWFISTVFQIFYAVLCTSWSCFLSDFFSASTISTRSSAIF